MARRAKGYLCRDGTFFDNRWEAEFYDAEQRLWDELEYRGENAELVLKLLKEHLSIVEDYVNAYKAREKNDSRNARVGKGKADDSGREEDDASVQQQSLGSDEPVSDMGGSK